jgi:hypothetical protein
MSDSIDKEEVSVLDQNLKLDAYDLPLIPQPTDDPNDPLNWSYNKKMGVWVMMATLAFFSGFSLAMMNPACMPSSLDRGNST